MRYTDLRKLYVATQIYKLTQTNKQRNHQQGAAVLRFLNLQEFSDETQRALAIHMLTP